MEQVIITYNNGSKVEKFGISLKEIFLTVDLTQVAVITYLGLDYLPKDFLTRFEVPIIAAFRLYKEPKDYLNNKDYIATSYIVVTTIILLVILASVILQIINLNK